MRSISILAFLASTLSFGQGLEVTLQATDYNGFNISCFGKKDGGINSNVTGGLPPYTYRWTTRDSTASISNVPAGYYSLKVTDANDITVETNITLIEPDPMRITLDPFEYPNGYHVSCNECYNGSIDVTVVGGVIPYAYQWKDGATTEDRTGLGGRDYHLTVTDANNCLNMARTSVTLREPQRGDWTLNGNAQVDPTTQYIGTSDVNDLVLKSNNTEQIRLRSDGSISLNASGIGPGLLYLDSTGVLKSGSNSAGPCVELSEFTFWKGAGNDYTNICDDPVLGTLDERSLDIITHGLQRMTISSEGKVGVGTTVVNDQFEVHTSLERGGLTLANSSGTGNAHTEIRFAEGNNQRWALGCDFAANGGQDFFIWNSVQNNRPFFLDQYGRVGIGHSVESVMGSDLGYLLYVDGSVACRELKVMVGTFPDYVFRPNYALMPLADLRRFIQREGHLPGIPSEEDVEEAGGVEVGDLQVRMLKVIEEQMLYILQLEERLGKLEQERN